MKVERTAKARVQIREIHVFPGAHKLMLSVLR